MAQHIARKRFGQHFLSDGGIIDAIVQGIAPQPGDAMVEIGPGLAALTQPLVERLGRLTVIELDRDLAKRLREHGQLDVIESDVERATDPTTPIPSPAARNHGQRRASGSGMRATRGDSATAATKETTTGTRMPR